MLDAGVSQNTISVLKHEEMFDNNSLKLASVDLLRGLGLKRGQILAIKKAFPTNVNVEVI